MKQKKKQPPKITKGAPSGFLVSLALHVAAFSLAGALVVFQIVQKEEKKFVPPKPVERPKMKLKKPKVQVKKNNKPKPTTRIVTKVNKASMPDIRLPEMSGMSEGLIGGIGGFEMIPDLGEITMMGGNTSIGNDFKGYLYDLNRGRRGNEVPMGDEQFLGILAQYARSGYKESVIAPYWRSPDPLYTTHFMVPSITAPFAPDWFGCPDVRSYYFFVKYEGKLVYKEDIRFRFWGIGDAYIDVSVDNKCVFLNGWPDRLDILDYWLPTDTESDKYRICNQYMHVGDWIDLKAGEPRDMRVFFGEWKGGQVAGCLLVEVEGVDYPRESNDNGPLLPAFKTEEFTLDMLETIYAYLPEGECTLTNGPVFRDF